jgi:hypothetical protein
MSLDPVVNLIGGGNTGILPRTSPAVTKRNVDALTVYGVKGGGIVK